MDFKDMSLDQMEKKGIIDLKVKMDGAKVKQPPKSGLLGSLPWWAKLGAVTVVLIFLFGLVNIPIYIYDFFN